MSDCEFTKKPVCPHCEHIHDDCWEWGTDEYGETDCHSCGKPFGWTQHVSVKWSTYLKENNEL